MKQFNKDIEIKKLNLKQNKNTYIKRLSISLACLILVCVIILFTFAKFETSSEEYTLINGILNLDNCEFDKGKEWTFDYSGSIKTFDAPCDGKYKLEVWGAQGGTNSTYGNYRGGYGGYSVGTYSTLKDNRLYVVVGGAGVSASGNATHASGGYNGGGSGWAAGGGGATHISTVSGLLSTLSSSKSTVLIVAGAGGGGAVAYGGNGGGYLGCDGGALSGNYANAHGKGGTQSAGGARGSNYDCGQTGAAGGFGYGGTDSAYDAAGGGAGWYGGGSGTNNCAWNTCGTGGGGSGYIGNASLVQNTSTNIINKMYCYGCRENTNLTTYTVSTYGTTSHQDERDTVNCANGFSSSAISKCAKSGNGYAKITYLGKR